MRARYSAFAVGDAAYLRATWDPRTRPRHVDAGAEEWTGLQVLDRTGGTLFDTAGTVAFRARHAGGVVEENSSFRREGGRWVYVGSAGASATGPVSDPFTTRRAARP